MLSIVIALSSQNMWMRGTRHHVSDVLVFRQNCRQRLDHVFDSLIRRDQPKRKEYSLSFHVETILVEIGVQKWQVWNAMRNHVDLAARYLENFLKKLR